MLTPAYFYGVSTGDDDFAYGSTTTLQASEFDKTDAFGLLYAELWVEARVWSTTPRDIVIKMEYGNVTEKVQATAIWAEMTKFHGTGKTDTMVTAVPGNREVKRYRDNFYSGVDAQKHLGTDLTPHQAVRDGIDVMHFGNGVEIEMTLYPAGVSRIGRVKFDFARSVENKTWKMIGTFPWAPYTKEVFQNNRDEANDDLGWEQDEVSRVPLEDRMYHFDAPGFAPEIFPFLDTHKRMFDAFNALEFIRVQIGQGKNFEPILSTPPPAFDFRGSRASELYPWHSWLYFKRDANDQLVRPTVNGQLNPAENELGQGLKALPTDPPA